MSKRIQVNYESKPCYDIIIEHSFSELEKELKQLKLEGRKIGFITDENTDRYYSELKIIFEKQDTTVFRICIKSGEENKNLATVQYIYEELINMHFDRKDILVALGGGVIGDMTGFAAATYLRGIDFIQIPTTLLSQVDSSVGGKTGVDFLAYKNMVGAFHMPKLVYINLAVLKTLDHRQFCSGMGEVLKYGLIRSETYYSWLISNMYEILDLDYEALEEMIYKSCLTKKIIVEKDPKEQGDRALLNFGHTIGHAIEKLKNFTLLHGECVALGSVAAAYVSYLKGYITLDEFYEIRDMFVAFNLPISVDSLEADEIIAVTKSDKKMEGSYIKFILLQSLGDAIIDTTVTDLELKAAIEQILYKEED